MANISTIESSSTYIDKVYIKMWDYFNIPYELKPGTQVKNGVSIFFDKEHENYINNKEFINGICSVLIYNEDASYEYSYGYVHFKLVEHKLKTN